MSEVVALNAAAHGSRVALTWPAQPRAPTRAHGCALAEVANQLGHADINVTAGYLGRKTQPARASDVMTPTGRGATSRRLVGNHPEKQQA